MIRSVLKATICFVIEAVCVLIGYGVPMLFDRGVGGAMASAIPAGIGSIIGIYVGLWAVRRIFD
jgi:hypothetical protein